MTSIVLHTFTKGDRVLKPGTFSDRYGTVIRNRHNADIVTVQWDHDGSRSDVHASELYAIED